MWVMETTAEDFFYMHLVKEKKADNVCSLQLMIYTVWL